MTKLPTARSFLRSRYEGASHAGDRTLEIGSSASPVPDARTALADFEEDEFPWESGSSDLTPSFRMGRLQLLDKLGSGSFATTYHAFDPLLERDVTLKVFHVAGGEYARDPEHFSAEVKALARLRHPRIVPIYDAGVQGEYHYIAMEFIEGRTLAESLADGPFAPRHAAGLVVEVAEALAYAHEHGIVHRDVKPSNIVLDAWGGAHLIDFGLAHRRGTGAGLGRGGAIRGTPAYLSPEQARGDDAVPHPANDQYSLGVVLYEMLCGRPPFSGPPLLVLVSALQQEPPRPRSKNPAIPAGLESICLKMLAKRAEDRYPSCQAMAEDVKRWLRGEPVRANERGPRRWPARWLRALREPSEMLVTLLMLILLGLSVYPRMGL